MVEILNGFQLYVIVNKRQLPTSPYINKWYLERSKWNDNAHKSLVCNSESVRQLFKSRHKQNNKSNVDFTVLAVYRIEVGAVLNTLPNLRVSTREIIF